MGRLSFAVILWMTGVVLIAGCPADKAPTGPQGTQTPSPTRTITSTYTVTSTRTLSSTPTPSATSSSTPTATHSSTPTSTATLAVTSTPTTTPTVLMEWGVSEVKNGGVSLLLRVNGAPYAAATVVVSGTGISAPTTVAYTGDVLFGQTFSSYVTTGAFTQAPGGTCILSTFTALGSAAATLTFPGPWATSVSVGTDGIHSGTVTIFNWTGSSSSDLFRLYNFNNCGPPYVQLPGPAPVTFNSLETGGVAQTYIFIFRKSGSVSGATGALQTELTTSCNTSF